MSSNLNFDVDVEHQRFQDFLDGSSQTFSLADYEQGSSASNESAETMPCSSSFISALILHLFLVWQNMILCLSTEGNSRCFQILQIVLAERARLLADSELFPTLSARSHFVSLTTLMIQGLYNTINYKDEIMQEMKELETELPKTRWEEFLRNQENYDADIVQILPNGSYSLLLAWQYEMRVIRAGINSSTFRANFLRSSQQTMENSQADLRSLEQKIPHKPDAFKPDMSFDLAFHNLNFKVTPIFQRPTLPGGARNANKMPISNAPMSLETATSFLNTLLGVTRGLRVGNQRGSWSVRIEGSRVDSESGI